MFNKIIEWCFAMRVSPVTEHTCLYASMYICALCVVINTIKAMLHQGVK